MTGGYGELLTDPRAFFERKLEDPSLLMPALMVTLVAIVSSVSAYINFQRQSEFMQRVAEGAGAGNAEGMANIFAAIGIISVVIVFVLAFVAWGYYALFTYGLSALLDGEGGFKSTAVVVGWGFVPKVLEVVVRGAGAWYVTSTVDLPDEISRSAIQAYSQAVQSHPVNIALILFGILMLFVSSYIWYNGLQVSRRLDSREALIAVGIPVAIVLLTRLWALFNAVA